jgi:dipeptidyl aminopeptidase/acylaminoacyl peptidase
MKHTLLPLFAVMAIAACGRMTQVTPSLKNTEIPSAVPTTPIRSTPSKMHVPTLVPSLTFTPTPTLLKLDDLPSGLYVVTVSEIGLHVRTLDGELIGHLALGAYSAPSLSLDNQVIAFTTTGAQFAFHDLTSTTIVFFTPYDMVRFNPSWSPDDSKVVLNDLNDTESINPHLGVIDIKTMKYERITFWPSGEFEPAWSPDGKWIAFASDHLRGTLYLDLFLLDTSCINEPETCVDEIIGPITSDRMMSVSEPSWSPDSRRLACNCSSFDGITEEVDLCVVDIETGRIEKLIDSPNFEVLPNWSPDGHWIAFQQDYANSVFIIRSDGSDQKLISQEGKFAFWLSIP